MSKNKTKLKETTNPPLLMVSDSGSTTTSSIITDKTTTDITIWKGGYVTDSFYSYYLDENMVKHYRQRDANKYSSNMKEEILDIAKKLYHNHLTPETATNLLLDLFATSGSLPTFKDWCYVQEESYDECMDKLISDDAPITAFIEWLQNKYPNGININCQRLRLGVVE